MLATPTSTDDNNNFADTERPGVQIARDLYSLANQNFAAIDSERRGCITWDQVSNFRGNPRLKAFLRDNGELLSSLAFTAKNLPELMRDSLPINHGCRISFADLNTFSWLMKDINRRNFYEGNFQSIREGVGLNAAAAMFLLGLFGGWALLAAEYSKLIMFLTPAEGIAAGVMATVGIPVICSMLGYLFGTTQADRYFKQRICKIDQILERLEKMTG